MRYFSGFGFKDEMELFEPFLIQNDFTVAGFSYGAIKAFNYVLNTKHRIDRLQLLSPAFFQDRDVAFKKLQTRSFLHDSTKYMQNFMYNLTDNQEILLTSYLHKSSYEELEELLSYEWREDDLQTLVDRGIQIEVYVGEQDRIVNAHSIKNFFLPFATIYAFKNLGHILQ